VPTPDINVRLTADGVQDVVNAFKRVQQEEKATKESTSLLGGAMEQLGELMPILTIGLVVEKMVEMGKGALDSAVSIGKLAQETGASVGTLSVLALAAHDVGVSQDEVSMSLVRLARNQEQATQGNVKSQQAFKALGISMADIKSKNPADLFVEIAQKLQQMPDGATKSAVAMQLFGRSGAQLIPVLNEIGKAGGFDDLKQKAQTLGLYLSDDFVAQAKQGEEALKNMTDVTQGLALQFMAGFVPEMAKGMEDVTKSVAGDGVSAFKAFGDFTGNVLRGIVDLFLLVGQTTSAMSKSLIDGLVGYSKTAWDVAKAYAHGDLAGAYQAAKSGLSSVAANQATIWGGYADKVSSEFLGKPEAPKAQAPTGGGRGGSGSGQSDEQFKKLVDARAAYQDAVANAELEKQKQRDALADSEDKAAYAAGLESLDEYYTARAARINAEADAEKAILQKKLDDEEAAAAKLLGKSTDYIKQIVAQGPAAVEAAAGSNTEALAMLAKVEQTKAKYEEQDLSRQQKLQDNDAQWRQEQVQASQKLLADRQKLYELEGDTTAAQQLALQRELTDTEQLLIRLGVAESERQQILARAAANANAKSQLGGLSQQGADALTSLDTQIAAIQAKAANGSISELDATAQIYKLEQQRLPILQQISNDMADTVDLARMQLLGLQEGTPAYEAQLDVVNNLQKMADQYSEQVDKISAGLKNQTTLAVAFSNALSTQGMTDIVGFFDAIGTGQETASKAFADLGKDFETMIVHMIDQMIVYYTLMAAVGWLAPGSSLFTSLSKAGPFGSLTGHADGGFTGNAPTNKVTGLVHGQEYVFKAAAVKRYGLPLLEAMNAGVGSVATGSYSGAGSSAGDGAVDKSALVQVNITNGSGAPVSQSQRTGSGGTSILDIVIGQVASDIAGGGRVGQSIQSTFGVSRKGQVRG
jgi:hypothetical protein